MQRDEEIADLIERADGPMLMAFMGSNAPESHFRLGTREYDWHSHVRGQVFCVDSGLLHVRTLHGSWLLPPHRAGWIPPGEPHWVSVVGALSGWSVIVTPKESRQLPGRPCVIGISALMRALVLRIACWVANQPLDAAQQRLAQVLLDEMILSPHEPLHLPMPSHPGLARVARAIFERPNDPSSAEDWAAMAAVSPRSLRRLMQAETGMSFAKWRQQARLIRALEMLAQKQPIAVIADELGYASPSNFIAMFRSAFGETPARYFKERSSVAIMAGADSS